MVESALSQCVVVVEKLAAKKIIVKFIFSGDYYQDIKTAASRLSDALRVFDIAIGTEQHVDLANSIKKLRDDLANVNLTGLREFVEQAAMMRELVEQQNMLWQQERHLSPAGGLALSEQRIEEIIISALQKANMSPGCAVAGTSVARSTQAEDASIMKANLQMELADLRRDKREQDEAYLAQIIAMLEVWENSSAPGRQSATAAAGAWGRTSNEEPHALRNTIQDWKTAHV
ncbi:hypothetical protein GPECTOR_53g153 [Gonium pectorale]|uniref:Uncharacterized protein n=1 Tax=Gonium pectorale TaxID=33097 RepID=A0A150G6U5_GONPE|nr:hypothetical protein GPECTOR_53g153 [Gonium pectorale]|eukprot:KXZ45567.1 hypothetical protein GPECTOR_53g153 [Gonium pectorale]